MKNIFVLLAGFFSVLAYAGNGTGGVRERAGSGWTCALLCYVSCSDTTNRRQSFVRTEANVATAFQGVINDCDSLADSICAGNGISQLRYDGDNSPSLKRNCVKE